MRSLKGKPKLRHPVYRLGPGVHWIQANKALQSETVIPVKLLSRCGTACTVSIDDQTESWRFEETDAVVDALDEWERGKWNATFRGLRVVAIHDLLLTPLKEAKEADDPDAPARQPEEGLGG